MLKRGSLNNISDSTSKRLRAVRSRGNKTTEIKFRLGLIRQKFVGWKMHPNEVMGKPDFYFPRVKLAIFVDGCFWHGCKKCSQIPRNNALYWNEKFKRNRKRDKEVAKKLKEVGITVVRIWEHEIKADLEKQLERVAQTIGGLRENDPLY